MPLRNSTRYTYIPSRISLCQSGWVSISAKMSLNTRMVYIVIQWILVAIWRTTSGENVFIQQGQIAGLISNSPYVSVIMHHISFEWILQSNASSYLEIGRQWLAFIAKVCTYRVFGHIDHIFVNLSRVASFRQTFYTFDVGLQPLTWPATLHGERTLTKAAHILIHINIQDHPKLWMGILILFLCMKVVRIRCPKCRHSGLWIWDRCTGLVTLPLRIGLVKLWNKS